MTEDDVMAMDARVLETPVDPAAEQTWAREVVRQFAATEQSLMAEYKMWRFVRDDARMAAADKELTRVRVCLAYARGLMPEGV